jgi:hypothetical protein
VGILTMYSNGTIANGIAKVMQGYRAGRDDETTTCYNWVGYFLRTHPEYDNGDIIVRFWGIKRETLDRSLIVHGDAICERNGLLISDAPPTYYDQMQLVVEYRWDELKRNHEI